MKRRFLLNLIGIGLLATTMQADEWNKKTELTVNETIMIPGATLEPGKYVMMLHDSLADRHIVQVFNEDQSKIIATILAIPNRRLEPTGETKFRFWETPVGEPPALRAWFFPGDLFGQEFTYSRNEAQRIAAANNNEAVPSIDSGDMKKARIYRSEDEYGGSARRPNNRTEEKRKQKQ